MNIVKNKLKFHLRNPAMTTASMAYFGGIFLAIVFVATAIKWPGSFPSYVLLSLAFNWLLFDALKKQYSAGYVFLALVMWIGFWLKFSMNTVFSTMWMEPIGNFDFSVEQVDTVSIVASIGAFGVMLAGKLFGAIAGKAGRPAPSRWRYRQSILLVDRALRCRRHERAKRGLSNRSGIQAAS